MQYETVRKQDIQVAKAKGDRCTIKVNGKLYGTFDIADVEMSKKCGPQAFFCTYRDKDNRSNTAVLRSNGEKLTRVSPFM